MRAILDTSVLISSWRPADEDEYGISVVSLAEMHLGVLRAAGTPGLAARLRRLSEVEHEFEPIPVDLSELRKGGGGVKCCTLEVRA